MKIVDKFDNSFKKNYKNRKNNTLIFFQKETENNFQKSHALHICLFYIKNSVLG